MKRGHTKALRALKSGQSFEDTLFPLLQAHFTKVEKRVRLTGFSGNKYIADFVVNDGIVVEASATFRVQQKVASTICKFVDLEKIPTEAFGTEDSTAHPLMRYAMVLKFLPQEQNQNRPIYRQAKAFGYGLFHPSNLSLLKEFVG